MESLEQTYKDVLETHPYLRIDPADYDFFVVQRLGHKKFDPIHITCKDVLNNIRLVLQQSPEISLYIHYPFCRAVCDFCHYKVFALTEKDITNVIRRYISYLMKEITKLNEQLGGILRGKKISTLYLGGGTPSLMNYSDMEQLMEFLSEFFNFEVCESTIETLPELISPKRVEHWQRWFNRISIGIQTLRPNVLANIGRMSAPGKISQPNEVIKKTITLLHMLRNSRQEYRLNFDLIYGIPDQTLEDIKQDLSTILQIVESDKLSFTLYRLRLHRGEQCSALYKRYLEGKLILPEQEHTYALCYGGSKFLKSLGFLEGPIGWFLKSYELQTYKDRWEKQLPLIGIGLSAYSYAGAYEWTNIRAFEQYFGALDRGLVPWSRYCLLKPTTRIARRLKYRMFLDNEELGYLRALNGSIAAILNDERLFMQGDRGLVLTDIGVPMVEEMLNEMTRFDRINNASYGGENNG
jgi:oxygen-independent coproporphyrinogen-3 oxidase